MAVKLRGEHFELSDEKFDLLYQACRLHTKAETHESVTVQTCFNADRLDLGRVGTVPKVEFLCIDSAKSQEMIAWAYKRSTDGVIPDNVLGNVHSLKKNSEYRDCGREGIPFCCNYNSCTHERRPLSNSLL